MRIEVQAERVAALATLVRCRADEVEQWAVVLSRAAGGVRDPVLGPALDRLVAAGVRRLRCAGTELRECAGRIALAGERYVATDEAVATPASGSG